MVDIWATALAKASPVPQPRTPAKYYFPPPWLLESLDGYDSNPNSEKTARFHHQWVTIRTFCRTRLFPGCFTRGGPLTGGEWRHALWGNYDVDDGVARPEAKLPKHLVELKTALRELFGGVALFPSYDPSAKPAYGETAVTNMDAQENHVLRQHLLYDLHETNWRCELLALDAVMMGIDEQKSQPLQRWIREFFVSRVWGQGTSGLDFMPSAGQASANNWALPPEDGWEACRRHLQRFLEVLSSWPGCVTEVRSAAKELETYDAVEYTRVMTAAVEFYVSTFVAEYNRLPVPPVRIDVVRSG